MKVRSHIYIKHASSKLELRAIKKVGQNWSQDKPKSDPRGLQMTSRIEVPAQWPLDCAWEAPETCHGRPWGGQAGGERELKVLSEGLPIHFLMPRWFWRGFGTSMRSLLEVFLKAFWRKTISMKTNSRNIKSCRNTCVFTIGLHVDVAADAFRDKETSSNCRCG